MAHGTRELTNQTERLKDVPKANLNQKKKKKTNKGKMTTKVGSIDVTIAVVTRLKNGRKQKVLR